MSAPVTQDDLRSRCRQCRGKLDSAELLELRRAFCCQGCRNAFYRKHCLICECPIDLKSTGRTRRFCSNKCRSTARRDRRFGLANATRNRRSTKYMGLTRNAVGNPLNIGLYNGDFSDRGSAKIGQRIWVRQSDEYMYVDRSDGTVFARVCPEGDMWVVLLPSLRVIVGPPLHFPSAEAAKKTVPLLLTSLVNTSQRHACR
jgi:hypothetical protein